jgi:dedicated sortase system histidine kinase
MRRLKIRGPRLGTKLMLLSLALLTVPVISYRQLVEMESFLIEGQSQAQLLTSEGISTLFNGREDLFYDLPVNLADYEALYAHPLEDPVRIDGRDNDWEKLENRRQRFGIEESESSREDGVFDLLLGERAGQLYAFLRIFDADRVYRNPNYLRLDNFDHVRLSFTAADGGDDRILITLQEPGVPTAYHMDEEWKFSSDGQPENRVQGYVEQTDYGYALEFRVPLAMLGSRRHFGVSVVDVDDPETREIHTIAQTLPKAGKQSFNLVVLRSPEVLNIIQGLGYSGARILVIDAQKRVRAETGSYRTDLMSTKATTPEGSRWFEVAQPTVRWMFDKLPLLYPHASVQEYQFVGDEVISRSLEGVPNAFRRRLADGAEIIMAAHPIIARNDIIGTVVVEQNTDDILALQRDALEQLIVVSVLSVLGVFIAILAFSIRLAMRIRGLVTETTEAIDQHGRMKTSQLTGEVSSGDEIGDLARSVSGMLSKLHQHNQFLENMPRTLRHELNNPLNALSTSLQNLVEEHPDIDESKYLDSAKRGVLRIGSIVQNLADAASLEESLGAEELEIIDIEELIENYVNNCRLIHPKSDFVFRGTGSPVYANVADYRIEQLLDKIIDNAVDFHWPNSPIKVQLDVDREWLQITVANRGPTLPDDLELFDSMITHRTSGTDARLHFGLGLYVVRVIAEHHGGSAHASNLADGSGVALMVRLPLAETISRHRPVWSSGSSTLKAIPN